MVIIMSTVAAIATPNAPGGIGIIRISGPDAIKTADSVFRCVSGKRLSSMKGYTAAFGHVYDGDRLVDECIATVFRAPKSYTGEDCVEISCHGGLYVTQSVLRCVFAAGADAAGPGEFTKRAFLNGRIDLTEAEGVMNIISAQGADALNASVTALGGALSKKIDGICASLAELDAGMAVWADYPDEDIPQVQTDELEKTLAELRGELDSLLSGFDAGQAVLEGVQTVICGHPNVGKSTLMNLLTGYDRSIVTSAAGTTRDVIEETVRLGNAVLRLADTAGLRDSDDFAESIGIEKAKERIERAGLVLAVFDASTALNADDTDLLAMCSEKRAVAVINKTDLKIKCDIDKIKEYIPRVVEMSAANGKGIKELTAAVMDALDSGSVDTSAAMLTTERQRACCVSARDAIGEALDALRDGMTLDAVTVSVDGAIDALLELTGKKARDAVVDEIFSKFCVGK